MSYKMMPGTPLLLAAVSAAIEEFSWSDTDLLEFIGKAHAHDSRPAGAKAGKQLLSLATKF